VQVPPGTLVIEATRRIGTEVPSFCYYPGLSLQAACRMCLVEVEKMPKLQTACTLVATEGMVVKTNSDQVRNARKYMLEFLLTNTRWIVRCATRVASANCRIWSSATARIPAASWKKKFTGRREMVGIWFITMPRAVFCASAACAYATKVWM
jgi:NADH-quinone oxidoreductase subunit G